LLLCFISLTFANSAGSPRIVKADTQLILPELPYWSYPNQEDFSLFQNGAELGHSVSAAGDLNNDGIDDVIVGSLRFSDTVDKEGAIFLFLGSPQGLENSPAWIMGGGQDSSQFGCAIDDVGDVNGDSISDILVGSCNFNTEIKSSGKISIYFGGTDITSKNIEDWSVLGDQKESGFGSALSFAGDINSDNYSDFVIGAKYYDTEGKTNNGKAFIFLGGENGEINLLSSWVPVGIDSYSMFGSSVAGAGDVDGNGYEDIIVGAPGLSGNGFAYVFLNSEVGLESSPSWSLTNFQAGAKFGAVVASMGDVNKDGFDDLLVGSPSARNNNDEIVGCVYLFHGSSSGINLNSDWKHCGDQVGGQFGATLTFVDDMDNDPDHTSDFLVGMPNYSESSEQRGAIFLFFGSKSEETGVSNYFEMAIGKQSESDFGSSLSSAGDVNYDRVIDVIVGSPLYKVSETSPIGRVVAYYTGVEGIPDSYQIFLPLVQR